jgi:hypothetical protein
LKPSQIIVVLDRCTDKTEEVVDGLISKYEKVSKVIKTSTRYKNTLMKGFIIAETVNVGLDNARPFSDFIMVANADSVYSSNYLEEAMRIFSEDPKCGMVGYSHYSSISGSGYLLRSLILYKLGNRIKECSAEDTYLQLAAMNFGYSIRSITTASVTLLRERGEGGLATRLKYAFAKGHAAYTLGYSPLYQFGRAMYWIGKGKFSYVAIIFGFIYAWSKKVEKLDIAFTGEVDKWQKNRIRSLFS